jgi:hypothetical protein
VNHTDNQEGGVTQVPEELIPEEREEIVDQALVLVEQLYVHLPLKRAMHAVDPVQRLKLLKYRLRKLSERRFHDEMISIFMGLRDMHTLYTLPASYHDRMAVLGFRIQRFLEGAEAWYMVTQVNTELVDDPHFKPGVVVTHWNGAPVERAVELNAARWAGSNPDARHARGLATMTVRPVWLTSPPDEEWVTVGYHSEGQEYETRLHWRMVQLPRPPIARALDAASDPLALTLGIDALVEAVQRTRKLLFAPEAMEFERQVTNLQARDATEPDHTGPALDMAEVSMIPHALAFQPVSTPHGEFGYLRIFSFDVDSPDDFVAEVVRIVRLLPKNGLIVDVRGNGGGKIPAGERLLQIFTPGEIEPERLQFICTPLTLKLCEGSPFFADWEASIGQAVETATPFSDGLPILRGEKERCNSIGQQYLGPVVLITDALCYSTTDFFAAGWQDHRIGHILGTDANTGAGGANVVDHAALMKLLPDPDSPIRPLPKDVSFSVSIRRTTRVGERLGDPLEDLGVVPDERHYTTKNDILHDNADLIEHAARILASLPVRALDASAEPSDDGKVLVSATVANVSRLDAYLDGRPRLTLNVEENSTEFELPLDSPGPHMLELRGFDDDRLVAVRRVEF